MPRQPRLRQKTVGSSTYWFTAAGGDRYFRNVAEVPYDVPYSEAKKRFAAHLASLAEAPKADNGLTVAHLVEKFFDWVAKNRGDETYSSRRTHINRFGNFKVGNKPVYQLPADKVRSADLEAFLTALRRAGRDPQTVLHHGLPSSTAGTGRRSIRRRPRTSPSPTARSQPSSGPMSRGEC